MARTINVTFEALGIKAKLDPSEVYTNRFVEELPKAMRFYNKM